MKTKLKAEFSMKLVVALGSNYNPWIDIHRDWKKKTLPCLKGITLKRCWELLEYWMLSRQALRLVVISSYNKLRSMKCPWMPNT